MSHAGVSDEPTSVDLFQSNFLKALMGFLRGLSVLLAPV